MACELEPIARDQLATSKTTVRRHPGEAQHGAGIHQQQPLEQSSCCS